MKIIHFPGNHQQRCQARYAIAADRTESAGYFGRTTILFMADESCPGGTFPNHGDTPNYLLNKVLEQELDGCRLQFIDVFYAGRPDERSRRQVYRWDFKPNIFEPKRFDPTRKEYKGVLDWLRSWMRLPGANESHAVTVDNPCAGVYPVVVGQETALDEETRIALLNRFGVLAR